MHTGKRGTSQLSWLILRNTYKSPTQWQLLCPIGQNPEKRRLITIYLLALQAGPPLLPQMKSGFHHQGKGEKGYWVGNRRSCHTPTVCLSDRTKLDAIKEHTCPRSSQSFHTVTSHAEILIRTRRQEHDLACSDDDSRQSAVICLESVALVSFHGWCLINSHKCIFSFICLKKRHLHPKLIHTIHSFASSVSMGTGRSQLSHSWFLRHLLSNPIKPQSQGTKWEKE